MFCKEREIKYVEARPGDYAGTVVSNNKSKNLIGWEPKVYFREGADRYLEWYKILEK